MPWALIEYFFASTLCIDDLTPRIAALFKRMLIQGADRKKILHQCNKAITNYP